MSVRTPASRQSLLQDIIGILAAEDALSASPTRLLEVIARHYDWQFGTLWMLDDDGRLRSQGFWQADPRATAPLAAANHGLALALDVGLPGIALRRGEPVWMADLAHNPAFVRSEAAASSHLLSGLAFPLLGTAGPLGVVEFLTDRTEPPTDDDLGLIVALARQIGQHVERLRADAAMRLSDAIKSDILATALDAIVSIDPRGRVTEWNPAAERIFGYPRRDALGRRMADLIIPEHLRPAHDRGFAHHLATGETRVLNQRLELTAVRADGSELPVELAITRQDTGGEPLFTAHLRDLTELQRIEQDLRGSHRELEAILEAVADSVLALSPDGQRVLYANRTALASIGQASLDALNAAEGLARALELVDEDGLAFPRADLPQQRVLEGEDQAAKVVGYRHPADGRRWMWLRARAIRDDDGRLAMVLLVGEDITAQKEEEGRLRSVAETLQASILPAELPHIPGVELSLAFTPRGGDYHEVGGDFYDAFALDGERWLLAVGDVSGKGPEAAAATSMCRYSLRALSLHSDDPAELLHQLNRTLVRHGTEERFATLALARLHRADRGVCLMLALGGHPQPLLMAADGTVTPVGRPGSLVGAFVADELDEEAEVRLGPGDTLVLYTDGITEARSPSGELFDLQGFLAGHRGWDAEQSAQAIRQAALAHQGGEPHDDIALVVIRVPEPPLLRARFAAEPRSVPAARHSLDALVERYPALDWEALKLMVSELVTNAIVHGRPRRGEDEQWFELTVAERVCEALRFTVSDPGLPFVARRRDVAPDATNGRGIMLVDTLADRWKATTVGHAEIWFERDLR